MKQSLLVFSCLFFIVTVHSQDSLKQRVNFYGFYTNFSKYQLNEALVSQGIPEIKTNRFGMGINFELEKKNWIFGVTLASTRGKNEKDNVTTKSSLYMGDFQLGHSIYKRPNFSAYAGLSLLGTTNTVTIFQDPKPTISLNNLLGATNNLIIKNDSYSAGVFAKAYFLEQSSFSPYISVGYYVPIAKTKWKADDSQIIDNKKENPFIFNVAVGFSLWGH